MKILMTAGIYALSGVTTVIENLSNQLGSNGLDITVGAFSFKRIPPKGCYTIQKIPLYNISKLKKFLNSFDIIHSHHPLTNYLAFLSHKPFIYHYHGVPDYSEIILRINMRLSINTTKSALDAVISVSESGAEELLHNFALNNVYVIYNGVDTDRFNPSLIEKFRKGKPQFLFVGNLYEHKKVGELVIAFNEVVKIYPKAYLQVVGEGNTYTYLNSLIRKFHLEDHVRLSGSLADSELPFSYGSCDVYVTPSRWELFGLPLLEAMACGKPVVASSIPPHVELITKSRAGVIYRVGDLKNLSKVMTKTYEERYKYKSNAIQFAKEHDWSIIAEHVMQIYILVNQHFQS
jgi:glycosyltransferase involved in cell wall biosynthesis